MTTILVYIYINIFRRIFMLVLCICSFTDNFLLIYRVSHLFRKEGFGYGTYFVHIIHCACCKQSILCFKLFIPYCFADREAENPYFWILKKDLEFLHIYQTSCQIWRFCVLYLSYFHETPPRQTEILPGFSPVCVTRCSIISRISRFFSW